MHSRVHGAACQKEAKHFSHQVRVQRQTSTNNRLAADPQFHTASVIKLLMIHNSGTSTCLQCTWTYVCRVHIPAATQQKLILRLKLLVMNLSAEKVQVSMAPRDIYLRELKTERTQVSIGTLIPVMMFGSNIRGVAWRTQNIRPKAKNKRWKGKYNKVIYSTHAMDTIHRQCH